ncbi:hypothetical protein UA08_02279 [Talaromyces atroroseus]|uniref:Uncharacterized protein n=1 Tax=Talaromyces atroroseus TaxID=1441469 RepID=A0A225AK16_TALAT|nr:hypothetical protein UA08_02279 [Talaromyces atroroseus]OKL61881.1 hypothetical protein UA08_02279 [Talaromyces atroroseus]
MTTLPPAPHRQPSKLGSREFTNFNHRPRHLLANTQRNMASGTPLEVEFPYSMVIGIPLPTNRIASAALRALQVDKERSPFVHRSFALVSPDSADDGAHDESKTVLQTTYRATTNRMLRVSVNSFLDTVGVVLGVVEELDVDVLKEELGK